MRQHVGCTPPHWLLEWRCRREGAPVPSSHDFPPPGLSGNMIYYRYVITLQLWYNKQSNYMSLWYITLDIIHPFFGLQHGLLLAPPAPRRPRHWLTPRKFHLCHTAHPFPKWHNGLAPAISYWGAVCHHPMFSGCSILHVMCNLSDSIILWPYSTPFHPIFPLLLVLFCPNPAFALAIISRLVWLY